VLLALARVRDVVAQEDVAAADEEDR
jgi:hypothetical protein